MRTLASLLRPARLAVPLALLALLGGATAAVAAVQPAPSRAVAPATVPKPAPFVWHTLSLINGWKAAATKSLVTGTPAWAVRDGVVYLRGAIKQTSQHGTIAFAQLPQSAWPTHNLYLQVDTNADVPGSLYIGADGVMEAYDGNSLAFESLAGVSYLTKTIKTSAISLQNGWRSSQTSYGTGNPAYSISNGVVYLSGSMYTDGTSRLAFILPKAARPAAGLYISVYTFDGSTGWLHIQSTGQVYVNGAGAPGYTDLASIAFPVAGTKWHAFALEAGWKSAASLFHTAPPSYAVVNGVIYLTGSMHQTGTGSGLWAFLPAAARTSRDVLDFAVDTSNGSVGAITVSNALGIISSVPFSNAQAFTSLAGIAYPPSS